MFALHSKIMIFDQKPDKSVGAAGGFIIYKTGYCYPANKSSDIKFISRGNPVAFACLCAFSYLR